MVTMDDKIPDVASVKCSLCLLGAGSISAIISKGGCTLTRPAIAAACELIFAGPEDPLADICAGGFW